VTGMFRSLRLRNYRLFVIGVLVSNTGSWMQRVAQTWLVLRLTNADGTALGITTGLQFLPILLFGLWGGVVADRFPKRRLLMVTQTTMGLLAAVLAVLDATGLVRVWMVYALAFALGLATAIDNPARQSFVVELVGVHDLPNAIGLNSATFNVGRMIGPAIGGLVVAEAGTAVAFALNAASFGALVLTIRLMRNAELLSTLPVARAKGQLGEAIRYLLCRRDLVIIMIVVGVISTFGQNFQIVVALMVHDTFHRDAAAYGLAFAAIAAGSIIGALAAARRRSPRVRYLLLGALAMGVAEILAAVAPTYSMFFALMVPIGLFTLTVTTTSNAIVQINVEPRLRGRIMSVYLLMNSGGRPLGAPLAGWVGATLGARWSFAMGGFAAACAAAALALPAARFKPRRGRDVRGPADGEEPAAESAGPSVRPRPSRRDRAGGGRAARPGDR
jgi:MFS family permease